MTSDLEPIPYIDLEEMERFREQNRKERRKFVKLYAEWVKKHSNKEWSSQQKEVVDGSIQSNK